MLLSLKKNEYKQKIFRLHEKLMEQGTLLIYFRIMIFNIYFKILLKVSRGSNRNSCSILQFLKIKQIEPAQLYN